jgi:hypothetical protein
MRWLRKGVVRKTLLGMYYCMDMQPRALTLQEMALRRKPCQSGRS